MPDRDSLILLALALAAGWLDAASYLGLGHVFPANMTGNTVLLGIALAKSSGTHAARSAAALGGFAVGVGTGVPLLRHPSQSWPRIAASSLGLEVAALTGLLGAWLGVGVEPVRYGLIALAGIAMGVQSAAVRASDVRGVNTTYMTSTFQNAIAGLVQRLRHSEHHGARGPGLPGAAWLTYGLGAVGGAFAELAWHAGAVAVPLAVVLVVTGVAIRGIPNPTQEQ